MEQVAAEGSSILVSLIVSIVVGGVTGWLFPMLGFGGGIVRAILVLLVAGLVWRACPAVPRPGLSLAGRGTPPAPPRRSPA